jgi:hypothetical protein
MGKLLLSIKKTELAYGFGKHSIKIFRCGEDLLKNQ